jgi:predicted TIM-barrel fold metal-dependent hydrolase
MEHDEMILISVDDHIIEPRDLFDEHLPAKWRDRAPRLVYDPERRAEAWAWEWGQSYQSFINAVVTLPNEEWGLDPGTQAEIRPGCYDVRQRIRDMDANGVLASLCFPSFPGMAGGFFSRCDDRDLALACVRAYNDWHIDQWCAAAPGRFLPNPISPIWDGEAAAEEVRRVARKGATSITFTEDPEAFGLPSIHSGFYDSFFRACAEEGVIVAIHIGSAVQGFPGRETEPLHVRYTMPTWNSLPCAANLLWSHLVRDLPDLKFALSEGGTSWIPGFLDRMERHFHVQRWAGPDLGGRTPTEVFRDQFLACFISDPSGLLLRDRVGIDNIAYEVDYPHSDCTFPNSSDELWDCIVAADCSESDIAKITHENAMRWFQFDPFAHVSRKEATVGALKARATDVDLSTRSKSDYRASWEAANGPVGG